MLPRTDTGTSWIRYEGMATQALAWQDEANALSLRQYRSLPKIDHHRESRDPKPLKNEPQPGESSVDLIDSSASPEWAGARLYTGSGRGWSPLRATLGLLALAALVGLTLNFSEVQQLQAPARVGPTQIFRIEEAGPARYQWTLFNGANAESPAIENQQILRFEQSDMVELDLPENLANGVTVNEGDPLVHFRSPTNLRRLEQLKAQRDELTAQRALLEAGQRPEAIEEARTRLQVARARRQRDQAELERLQTLEGHGAVSAADLEAAELQERIRALQVSVEKASLVLESAPVRQEQLAEVDARLAATNAAILEIEQLLEEQTVYAPISGQVRLGGSALIEVMSSTSIVIHLPIPQGDRYRVAIGDPVEFTSQMGAATSYEGNLIDIADQPEMLGAEYVFWAAASIPVGEGLKIGMTGTARMKMQGEDTGFLASLRRQLLGP